MKTRIKTNRILSFLVSVLLVISLFGTFSINTSAAVTTKKQKSYDIAIAFDNSGSMYDNKSWCRAKYAMEIFASMLDYEKGDRLRIYPMWEVATDGSTPVPSGNPMESSAPVIIDGNDDIDKISNLYTIHASGTPFTPVTKAYEYLVSSSASEKWLIVLSDGAFDGAEKNESVLRDRLISMATNGNIKIQYLGFAGAKEIASDVANGMYAKKSTDVSLMSDLVDICNSIFQRSILPAEYYNNNTLNIDLSMRKVIVFVQGQGARIESLKKSDGGSVAILQESGQRKYSQISVGKYYQTATPPIDDSLYGEVVTFDECPKGQYTLNCPGAKNVQIFYEPDVDIKVSLTDENGNSVDVSTDGIDAGEYTISSIIVDGTTGEDVTNHKLMGNDVLFTTYVRGSNESSAKRYENGAKIRFEPDDKTEVIVEGTYLKDYTISTKDDPNAFPLPLFVREQSLDFAVQLSQLNTDYKIASHAEWKPIKATLSIDGRPLSEAELQRTDVSFKMSNGISFYAEAVPNESAYNLYVGRDENNNVDMPPVGNYDLEIMFSYVDEYGKQFDRSCEVSVNVVCDLSVTAVVEQSQAWYKIRDHEKWKPIKLQMTVDGAPLTEEQLARVQPTVSFNNNLPYRCEMSPTDSSYYVYIGSDENGNYVEPSTGKYKMQVSATFVDEYGNSFSDDDTVSFEIQRYSKIWRILIWILAFLILLVLWLLYMMQKVLPKSIVKDTANFNTMSSGELDSSFVDVEYSRKGKSLTISGSPAVDFNEQCSASFDLRAVDNRFTKSNRRRIAIVGINSVCDEVKIAGTKYVNYDGQWIKVTDVKKAEHGYAVSPTDQEISCSPRFEFSRAGGLSNLTCKTKTVK